MPEKMLLPVSPSVLVTVCWINETASNLTPFIAIFNLGNKESQLGINQGSRVDRIAWESRFAKNSETMPEDCTSVLSCRR
jgi:hypothetical protein